MTASRFHVGLSQASKEGLCERLLHDLCFGRRRLVDRHRRHGVSPASPHYMTVSRSAEEDAPAHPGEIVTIRSLLEAFRNNKMTKDCDWSCGLVVCSRLFHSISNSCVLCEISILKTHTYIYIYTCFCCVPWWSSSSFRFFNIYRTCPYRHVSIN